MDVDGVEHGYYYHPDGRFAMSEVEIDKEQLPAKLKAKVEGKIREVSMFTHADGFVEYEVKTKNAEYRLSMVDGKVKMEEEEDDEDDDDDDDDDD